VKEGNEGYYEAMKTAGRTARTTPGDVGRQIDPHLHPSELD